MKTKTITSAQLEDFTRRILSELPDSLEQRISDLEVLAAILPRSNSSLAVLKMLAALKQSQQAQHEFCFNFTKLEAA